MRRRITEAIVAVTALVLVVVGVPLALVVRQSFARADLLQLETETARALGEVEVPLNPAQLAALKSEPDAPDSFAVYDAGGHKVVGDGPARADRPVRVALRGGTASSSAGALVVASAVTESATERLVGAVRLERPLGPLDARVRVAWLVMGLSAGLALLVAWAVGRNVASRLSAPLTELADVASQLGGAAPVEHLPPSGIPEIDTLAAALAESAQRVDDSLARERRFSSDVSHQLRTPLTSLRLRLGALEPGPTLDGAVGDLDRVDATVAHLLAVARDEVPVASTCQVDQVVSAAVERWEGAATAAGRNVVLGPVEAAVVGVSPASVDEVLDVLIDNALRHGSGDVVVVVRQLPGGAAVDVADGGSGLTPADTGRIFDRGEGVGNGIGLALARSLAEAHGGRLVLSHYDPTTFSLVLLSESETAEA